MNRKAILIGSNYDKTISGVMSDIFAWKKFLLSPIGGAWDPDELTILADAQKTDNVINAINSAESADYAFITFSGHGGTYRQERNHLGFPETVICLGESEFLSEYQLNPGRNCPRCTIILDCCRTYINDSDYFTKIASVSESHEGKLRSYFRDSFDSALARSDMGCVKIYATGINHTASDENSFSRVLTETSRSYMQGHTCSVLRLNDAFDIAESEMRKLDPQQQPQYCAGRRHNHFPFAVNPLVFG